MVFSDSPHVQHPPDLPLFDGPYRAIIALMAPQSDFIVLNLIANIVVLSEELIIVPMFQFFIAEATLFPAVFLQRFDHIMKEHNAAVTDTTGVARMPFGFVSLEWRVVREQISARF
jgi:hypothetical protein